MHRFPAHLKFYISLGVKERQGIVKEGKSEWAEVNKERIVNQVGPQSVLADHEGFCLQQLSPVQ